jgi:hypothetical protein
LIHNGAEKILEEQKFIDSSERLAVQLQSLGIEKAQAHEVRTVLKGSM